MMEKKQLYNQKLLSSSDEEKTYVQPEILTLYVYNHNTSYEISTNEKTGETNPTFLEDRLKEIYDEANNIYELTHPQLITFANDDSYLHMPRTIRDVLPVATHTNYDNYHTYYATDMMSTFSLSRRLPFEDDNAFVFDIHFTQLYSYSWFRIRYQFYWWASSDYNISELNFYTYKLDGDTPTKVIQQTLTINNDQTRYFYPILFYYYFRDNGKPEHWLNENDTTYTVTFVEAKYTLTSHQPFTDPAADEDDTITTDYYYYSVPQYIAYRWNFHWPKAGQWLYADGTYSFVYTEEKTCLGMILYKNSTETKAYCLLNYVEPDTSKEWYEQDAVCNTALWERYYLTETAAGTNDTGMVYVSAVTSSPGYLAVNLFQAQDPIPGPTLASAQLTSWRYGMVLSPYWAKQYDETNLDPGQCSCWNTTITTLQEYWDAAITETQESVGDDEAIDQAEAVFNGRRDKYSQYSAQAAMTRANLNFWYFSNSLNVLPFPQFDYEKRYYIDTAEEAENYYIYDFWNLSTYLVDSAYQTGDYDSTQISYFNFCWPNYLWWCPSSARSTVIPYKKYNVGEIYNEWFKKAMIDETYGHDTLKCAAALTKPGFSSCYYYSLPSPRKGTSATRNFFEEYQDSSLTSYMNEAPWNESRDYAFEQNHIRCFPAGLGDVLRLAWSLYYSFGLTWKPDKTTYSSWGSLSQNHYDRYEDEDRDYTKSWDNQITHLDWLNSPLFANAMYYLEKQGFNYDKDNLTWKLFPLSQETVFLSQTHECSSTTTKVVTKSKKTYYAAEKLWAFKFYGDQIVKVYCDATNKWTEYYPFLSDNFDDGTDHQTKDGSTDNYEYILPRLLSIDITETNNRYYTADMVIPTTWYATPWTPEATTGVSTCPTSSPLEWEWSEYYKWLNSDSDDEYWDVGE